MHMLCAKLWVIQLLIGCIECDIQQDNLFSFWYCKLQELHLRIVLSKFPVRLELKEGKSTWKNQLSQNRLDKYRIFLTLAEKCRGGKYVHENPAWFFSTKSLLQIHFQITFILLFFANNTKFILHYICKWNNVIFRLVLDLTLPQRIFLKASPLQHET